MKVTDAEDVRQNFVVFEVKCALNITRVIAYLAIALAISQIIVWSLPYESLLELELKESYQTYIEDEAADSLSYSAEEYESTAHELPQPSLSISDNAHVTWNESWTPLMQSEEYKNAFRTVTKYGLSSLRMPAYRKWKEFQQIMVKVLRNKESQPRKKMKILIVSSVSSQKHSVEVFTKWLDYFSMTTENQKRKFGVGDVFHFAFNHYDGVLDHW